MAGTLYAIPVDPSQTEAEPVIVPAAAGNGLTVTGKAGETGPRAAGGEADSPGKAGAAFRTRTGKALQDPDYVRAVVSSQFMPWGF